MQFRVLLAVAFAVACVNAALPDGELIYEASLKGGDIHVGDNRIALTQVKKLEGLPHPTLFLHTKKMKDGKRTTHTEAQKFVLDFGANEEMNILPPLRFIVRDDDADQSSEVALVKGQWDAEMPVSHLDFKYEAPLSDVPESMNIKIYSIPAQRSRFTYTMKKGELQGLKEGKWFDMTPENSTFGVQFVLMKNPLPEDDMMDVSRNQTVSVWIRRLPPIPPFTFFVYRNDELMMMHFVNDAKPPGVLFESVLGEGVRENDDDTYTVTAVFSEFHREHNARALISDAKNTANQVKSGPMKLATTDPNVKLTLLNYEGGDGFGFEVHATKPIKNLLLRLVDTAGNTVFLAESRHVPYGEGAKPIGWSQVISGKTIDRIGGNKATINLHFDDAKDSTAFDRLRDWLHDYDAHLHNLVLKKKMHKSGTGVFTKHKAKSNQALAVIPFNLVVTDTLAEHSGWGQEVNKSADFQALKLSHSEKAHALMTLFAITGGVSPVDSTSFSAYWDSLPTQAPYTPLAFTPEEVKLFEFMDLAGWIDYHKKLVAAEWRTIAKVLPWFEKAYTYKQWFNLRNVINTHSLTMNQTVMMIPALDYINHADEPNAHIVTNPTDNTVVVVSTHGMDAGEEIRIHYGSSAQNKFEFLTKYGMVPNGSPDATYIDGKVLTIEQDSRLDFMPKRKETSHGLKKFEELLQGELAKAQPDLDKLAAGVPGNVVVMAKRMLAARKKVLKAHLEFIENDFE